MTSSSHEGATTNASLTKLQELSERRLTIDILIPLLRTFGFDKVEHHGGAYEQGKDLICWRRDELDLVELAVAQVKKYQPTAKASDNRSFSEIVTQLQQAAEETVPNTDGIAYYPSLLYFITPFPVETRALQSRFEGYSSLSRRRVKIIDGPLLLKMIWKNLPKVAKELAGPELLISDAVCNTLTNADLLSALSTQPHQDISSFYCDLDFGVGKISTRILFSLIFKPTVQTFPLRAEEWPRFKAKCQFAESAFGVKLTTSIYEIIEKDFEKRNDNYIKNQKLDKELSSKIKKHNYEFASIERKLFDHGEHLGSNQKKEISDQLVRYFGELISRLKSPPNRFRKGQRPRIRKDILEQHVSSIIKFYSDKIEPIELKLFGEPVSAELVSKYLRLVRENIELECQKNDIAEVIAEPPVYNVKIAGHALAKKIEESRKWMASRIEAFNEKEPLMLCLKEFLLKCEQLFEKVDRILGVSIIRESIGIPEEQKYICLGSFKRLSLSVHSIFDTGLNIAVLGEAGAGKTTSLQMYAKRRLESDAESELTIFAPLARVVAKLELENELEQKDSPCTRLERGIGYYLRTLGIDVMPPALLEILKRKRVLLLLDGIDEAIVGAPWILEGIKELGERYPQAKIIVSSRMSGKYLQQIPFFGITLLPFTDGQRERFIRSWFQEQSDEKIKRILDHLNHFPGLSEIVRNPLLATILCVLADHNVPLPDSEVRLYEERLRLLMGQYDIHKKVVRLKSSPYSLELVTRKLGYLLHKARKRYEKQDILTSLAVNVLISVQ